ncbi:phage T7 F exclusion suppressor FxsA [compost metagenome]
MFGLLCLIPFTRRLFIRKLLQRAREQAMRQRAFADDLAARSGQTRPNVIEGEYERRDR